MLRLRDVFEYCKGKITGHIPPEDRLRNSVEVTRKAFEFAQKGIHPAYPKNPFDTQSQQGKNYIKYCRQQFETSQSRLHLFYPESRDSKEMTTSTKHELGQ